MLFFLSVLSFSKPQLNFKKIKMSRILLSITVNFGCSSYHIIISLQLWFQTLPKKVLRSEGYIYVYSILYYKYIYIYIYIYLSFSGFSTWQFQTSNPQEGSSATEGTRLILRWMSQWVPVAGVTIARLAKHLPFTLIWETIIGGVKYRGVGLSWLITSLARVYGNYDYT